MKFIKDFEKFIKNLQSLPENKKKIIIFTIIGIAALIMFFWGIKSTARHISKINESTKSIHFSQIELENNKELELNLTNDQSNLPIDSDLLVEKELLTYENSNYEFTINYPQDWYIDHNQTNDSHLWIQKEILKEVASLHIEIIDKNQKIQSTEDGVNYIISQMKDITKEQRIKIGNLDGYEVVGKICTSICSGLSSDSYFPFSVIYFSKNDIIFKIKYSEGIVDMGWKNTINDWQFYNEYKNIISTFKFTPTP